MKLNCLYRLNENVSIRKINVLWGFFRSTQSDFTNIYDIRTAGY